MTRDFDVALRERRESEQRLADVRIFAARLKTQEERLTIIAELQAAWEAAETARTAIPETASPPVAQPPLAVWTPPQPPPANDLGQREAGFMVDRAAADRLETFIVDSVGGVTVAMAADELGVRRPVARHTLGRLAATRGTIAYSNVRYRWYAADKLAPSRPGANVMTLEGAIVAVLSNGDALDAKEIAARVVDHRPNTHPGSVKAQISRMESVGTIEAIGLFHYKTGRLYRLRKEHAVASQ